MTAGRLPLVGVSLMVVALWSGSARSQDEALQAKVDKLVQLNKAALGDVDNYEWDRAKQKLLEALILAKKSGLDNHPLTARTYVHLGVVYVRGFKNREKALQSFSRAFEIQPDITLSRAMATADVNDAFAAASGRPSPIPRTAAPSLECPVAEQTQVDQAVPVRCAVSPNVPVTKVFLFYREPVKQRFTEVEMNRMPEGSFQGRIPERVIHGQSVQFYFEGRNAAGKPIVRNGEEQSPNVIVIVKR